MYRDRLQAEFPALQFALFHNAAEVSGDLSDIDVMMMFGIEIRDPMLAAAPQLKWIQSLATGVDHFLRCPSLKPDVLITSGRGIHGPPMREQVIYLMMAVSRTPSARSKTIAPHLVTAALEHAARQDGCRRRHRHCRRCDRRAAQSVRHACHRRHAHAAQDRRLRRDDAGRPPARGRGQGRLSHQHPAGQRGEYRAVRRQRVRRDEAVRLLYQCRPRPDRR